MGPDVDFSKEPLLIFPLMTLLSGVSTYLSTCPASTYAPLHITALSPWAQFTIRSTDLQEDDLSVLE